MTFNKKKNIVIGFIVVCCIAALCYAFFSPNNEETISQNQIQTPEISNEEKEQQFKQMQLEQKESIKNWNLALSIATDIYKSVLDSELNLDSVYFNNKGMTNIDGVDYYTISLTNEEQETLKVIGIDLNNNNFVYINDKKTEPISNYQYIGNFVNSLNPWYLYDNKIVREENNQYERYGTIVYLYRENGILKLSVSTYNGFAEIAQIIVSPTLSDDNTLTFTFDDDKFGNSGSGTIKFVSKKELEINIKTNKTEFGIFSGQGKLFKATS